ncbi:ABC transporter ATP-binding protein [Bifidobacterium sp. UTCIF-3]|nr:MULTISPECIES: ATP-binding cassette domain-containing protein [unclassified Bifidobacterium]TPF77378.1 ABC transporter ATP-binding protein [Bifidobacterium sp. UTCIF-1]TPF80784.1 ABC transporter ATP-binding protein [Bifidobacterium sp. UTCIF-24]TPF82776.1 ABC transporter ATP-binding protein [Bifidobacterium sp. UTCIF-3]TPF83441.1 ABC transporter ATP-binding protein [Bifidobacterium sp. UTCIF-36]TPF90989.1 ABC transporter ATP-binding protein [Bifidobacterium sp. UTBIF-56]
MFDKRLFQLAPGLKGLVAGKVALMWVGLLANIGFMLSLVMLLQGLLVLADPHLFACDAASSADCPVNLFDVPGLEATPMTGDLLAYVLLMIVCAAIRYATTTGSARLGTEAAERVKLALRSKLYRKMLRLGPSYASRVKTSDVVQSAGEGVEQIQSFFELFLPQLFYAILAPITLFAVIAPIDMPSALTMLLCAPLIIIVTGMVSMTAARAFKKYWGRYTDMGAAFLDNLQGLETLKNFDADDRAAVDMDRKAEGFRVMTMRVLQIQLRSLTAMDVVAYGGAAAGIGVALWRYAHTDGTYMPGTVWQPIDMAAHLPGPLAYVAYGLQYLMPFGSGFPLTLAGLLFIVLLSAEFFIPMRQLGSFFHVAMNGMTSTKRIFALLDAPEPAHGSANLPASTRGEAGPSLEVEFSDVSFSYEDAGKDASAGSTEDKAKSKDKNTAGQTGDSDARNKAPAKDTATQALADVSFTARPGELTAIVGVSGSGKSTAAALIAGTLEGYQGSLTIGGVESRELSGETLARNVTLIGASSHLFAGTLRENLTMALPQGYAAADSVNADGSVDSGDVGDAADSSDAVERRLWAALEQARIADFVRSQPAGLDMTIEPDAANLSGGQRQRIAIARALLHDSPIFVFDEATSSVDVESEELILATIRELAHVGGKTVIMITHRMANAGHADQVVVFDHAHVVETGTHASLLAAHGRYAELYATQAAIENIASDAGQDTQQTVGVAAADADAADAADRTNAATDAHAGAAVVPADATLHSDTAADSDPDAVPSTTATGSNATVVPARLTTFQTVTRLLKVAAPLTKLMVAATVSGSIGHLAATFLPVFGIVAGFALAGNPVWGIGVVPAVVGMIICALLRGITRYVEQYLNHNVAFHLLALFRSKAFAALRRLAPAKLAGKGKGDLIAMLTTDVELLEIFFAHTISPVAIAITTTIVYAIIAATLNPWMALALVASHLVVGVLIPKFFATGVRNLGPAIRGAAGQLDNVMLDDMRGLDEIIRFGRGEDRARAIEDRTRALWRDHARLSRVNGRFAGIGGLIVIALNMLVLAVVLSLAAGDAHRIPALVAAFVLFTSSFGPTLALSALPANLTQTFAAARRLFGIMDEAPAVIENGTSKPDYQGMTLDHVTFAYPTATLDATASAGSTGSAASAGSAGSEAKSEAGNDGNSPSRAILDDFTLDIPRHGILGVQGPSGRGKSTMLKLLMRYWDPQSGRVLLSDTPLPEVDAHHRRLVQAMMSQDTHLFDGTIRDNLLIALPESVIEAAGYAADDTVNTTVKTTVESAADSVVQPTPEAQSASATSAVPSTSAVQSAPAVSATNVTPLDARLREALAKASVLDLVDSLPNGLDTQVGELGDRLSEGERQRIGLARVFLRNADIVLFDEPTSRLDALNEAIILRSIRGLAQDADAAQSQPEAASASVPGPQGAASGHASRETQGAESQSAESQGVVSQATASQSAESHAAAVILVSHRESAMRVADRTLHLD